MNLTLSPTRNVMETSAPTDGRTVTQGADAGEWTFSMPSKSALRDTLARLAEFEQLHLDWDSYGGVPSTTEAVDKAGQFLSLTFDWLAGSENFHVIPDLIAPLPNGGVHLRWRGTRGDLEVEFTPQGRLGYLFVRKHDGEEQYEEEDDAPWTTVMALLTTVLFP